MAMRNGTGFEKGDSFSGNTNAHLADRVIQREKMGFKAGLRS